MKKELKSCMHENRQAYTVTTAVQQAAAAVAVAEILVVAGVVVVVNNLKVKVNIEYCVLAKYSYYGSIFCFFYSRGNELRRTFIYEK